MYYSKLQKTISFSLIFFILVSFTLRIPFFTFFGAVVLADDVNRYNLVSIIVEEDVYDEIEDRIERYASDIQGVLENTKTIIIPTSRETNPFNIASLNEKLYFEGYKGLNGLTGNSQLIGTVIVGDLPLPVVFDNNSSEKTLVPYVDFEDKTYIYNHEDEKYLKNENSLDRMYPEIWHGVISPNTDDNIQALKDYFDKNHDFYEGTGNFDLDNGIINGKNDEGVSPDYKPYVFYFDQYRENASISYSNYKGYELYLDNLEDFAYNRFSKKLVQNLQEKDKQIKSDEIGNDLSKIGLDGLDLSKIGGPDIDTTPDIHTRHLLKEYTKRFLDIFNGSTIGDLRAGVNNAGRFSNGGGSVNVDMVPAIIATLDELSRKIIKNVNNSLENEIDNRVKSSLSRNIALPLDVNRVIYSNPSYNYDEDGDIIGCDKYNTYITYEDVNILNGKQSKDITSVGECSIFKGSISNSGTLVEANRATNLKSGIQDDMNLLLGEDKGDGGTPDHGNSYPCSKGMQDGTSLTGYWGKNTPLWVDNSGGSPKKKEGTDLNKSIIPLFDIEGSVESKNEENIPSALDCLDNNYLKSFQKTNNFLEPEDGASYWSSSLNYRLPINGEKRQSWSCTDTTESYDFTKTFEELYKDLSTGGSKKTITLDGTTIKTGTGIASGLCGVSNISTYSYKSIPSYLEHKSPTAEEIISEIENMITPALPIDRDRYIDFISAKGNYKKINYPYLYRLEGNIGDDITLETADSNLKEYLSEISENVNNVIASENPDSLTGEELEVYNFLKVGDYDSSDLNLYNFLKGKPDKTIDYFGESKTVNYYDTLVFATYWNSLNSVPAKYKFVIENYLNDQINSISSYAFPLPLNKKSYEISYIGAKGNAANMFIKVDPEGKGKNPYADIIKSNIDLVNKINGSNISGGNNSSQASFKCAPPEGVPIWKWIPAVICRLKTILPPTIKIGKGDCGADLLSDDEFSSLSSCNKDSNKNGVNDCLEENIKSLSLKTDSDKYYYNTTGKIEASILGNNDNILKWINSEKIFFEIEKVEVPKNSYKDFDSSNKKTIYDINLEKYASANSKESLELVAKYLTFNDIGVRTKSGKAIFNFSTKNKDADITFRAYIILKDQKGNFIEKYPIFSNSKKVEIRGDRLFVSSSKVSEVGGTTYLETAASNMLVSDLSSVFLIDEGKFNLDKESFFDNLSEAKEKLIFSVSNYSKDGNLLPLNYPLSYEVYKEEELINTGSVNSIENYLQISPTHKDINGKIIKSFTKSGKYTFKIIDSQGFKVSKNIELLPELPEIIDIELSSNISEVGGVITTHMFKVYDKFGNLVSGEPYKVKAEILGNGLTFANLEKEKEFNIFEGYKVFSLKSTNKQTTNIIKFSIVNDFYDLDISSSNTLKTLNQIPYSIDLPSEIKVGNNTYPINLEVELPVDANLNEQDKFNSRVYLNIPSLYGESIKPFYKIINGKAYLEFQTKTTATKKVNLEFQIEGIKEIKTIPIVILPETPIRTDLSLSSSSIEAKEGVSTDLTVELKDRYDNLVFTDSTTNMSLEIPEKYEYVISSSPKASGDFNISFTGGIAKAKINASDIPGRAYFKIDTNISLDNNYFEVGNGTGALVINGVGENAGKIDTYYLWNKEKLNDKKYNGIYTTLLGSNYGDITQKDYLGSALLFNKDNRSLAVTSLLNNPNGFGDVLSINNSGNINILNNRGNLSQNIDLLVNGNFVEIYNKSLNKLVGKVYYNLDKDNIDFNNCNLDNYANFSSCDISNEKTSILLKNLHYNYEKAVLNEVEGLSIKNKSGENIFRITKDLEIDKAVGVYLEIDKDNREGYLAFYVKQNGVNIGYLAYNFENSQVNTTRDFSKFTSNSYLNALKNNIVVYLPSKSYATRSSYLGNSTYSDKGLYIWYNDNLSLKNNLSSFSKSVDGGYENFENESGIGWKDYNKSLLSYSAGKTVGESTKEFMSFSLINLGDPVISLKKIKKKLPNTDSDRSFDDSIGDIIDKGVISYKVFDYNNDNREDIVVLRDDGHVDLYENSSIEERFVNKGSLLYIADLGTKAIMEVGDFTGDSYDDIFLVNDKNRPILLNNNKKDFVRKDLSEAFSLDGRIMQAEVFDMDADLKDDIIIFDDSGVINIFYGSSDIPVFPLFTKNTIGTGLGIQLSSLPRTDAGVVYFDGLYQLPQDPSIENVTKSESISEQIQANIASMVADQTSSSGIPSSVEEGSETIESGSLSPIPNDGINEDIVDKFIFLQTNYNPEKALLVGNLSDEVKKNAILEGMPSSIMTDEMKTGISNQNESIGDLGDVLSSTGSEDDSKDYKGNLGGESITGVDEGIVSAGEDVTDFMNSLEDINPGLNIYDIPTNDNTLTTFLKSEYSDSEGLQIRKTFNDKNGGTLKGGDTIDIEVIIENTSLNTKNNIAFLDSVVKPFSFGEDILVEMSFSGGIKSYTGVTPVLKTSPVGSYAYLLDVYSLKSLAPSGEVFTEYKTISLDVGEQLILKYSLETSPFKFGYINVGLLENDEAGDDIYGDVAFKPKKENCGDKYKLYRSKGVSDSGHNRDYVSGEKLPDCDEDKAGLPEEIEKNSIDENKNGIPDYIDDLTSSATGENKDDFMDFAKAGLNEMNKDSDGDGIPDREDLSPNSNDDDDFMDSLDSFADEVETMVEGLETIINGLGCGFGGGGCIATPINAAPLAPGSSITLFGCPIAPAGPSELFVAWSGIPAFSALTYGPLVAGLDVTKTPPVPYVGPGLSPIPHGVPVWVGAGAGPGSSVPPFWPFNFIGAGGIYGRAPGPIRIFITPTLTGAVGTAICFGNNVTAPRGFMPGIYPVVPGGNCIIAAMPLFGCSDDGSDGNIAGTGLPSYSGDFGVYNGNCEGNTGNEGKVPYLGLDNIRDYIDYKEGGGMSSSLSENLEGVFSTVADTNNKWIQPNAPLLNMDMGGDSGDMEVSVDLDFSAIKDGNFSDILKIDMKRIWPFPDFIMDWVTRQVEEIVTKLTDFPSLIVILPDFDGIFDGWKTDEDGNTFFDRLSDAYDKGSEENKQYQDSLDKQIELLEKKCKISTESYDSDGCIVGEEKCIMHPCAQADMHKREKITDFQTLSGIQAAYDFLSNLPLISLEQEPVNVNLPWIDKKVLMKTIFDWNITVEQRKSEVKKFKEAWSFGNACEDTFDNKGEIIKTKEACKEENAASNKIIIDAEALINSLEKNIEILEGYKRLPEDLNRLIRIKEVRLEQILCNIESITFMLGGRIGKNGKIFKTWVELYILIKAILNSWQLIIDIFYAFDVECHECKNERADLRYCIIKLISFLIPKIPIIIFPKWPDIILDLHNVRAGLRIPLPDFKFNLRPILLPTLPKLYLPEVPNIKIPIPSLPLLPELVLPQLPDLPTLPTIELPDLPPAPTLPKLFASIEAILTILKLLLKIYCLLQKSILAPEWAAGQRIAHITERGGYIPSIDFLGSMLPQFSFPFIDAIKVTTYVNLEFEADFIVEFARNLVMPINVFTNNIVNMLDIGIADLDFRGLVPQNIDIGLDGEVKTDGFKLDEINYNNTEEGKEYAYISIFTLTTKLAKGLGDIIEHIDLEKDNYVSNNVFLDLANNSINKKWIIEDSSFDELRMIWERANEDIVNNSKKSDLIIEKLQKNNTEKFDTLKNIISTELQETKRLREELKNVGNSFDKISTIHRDTDIKNVSIEENTKIDLYNDSLEKFNYKTFDSIRKIGNTDNQIGEFKEIGKEIIKQTYKGKDKFNDFVKSGKDKLENEVSNVIDTNKSLVINNIDLLAADLGEDSGESNNSCATGKPNTYSYKGLYIVEETESYRLFNYLDELAGNEEVKGIDFDNDSDEDLLYQVGKTLYLKENLKEEKNKIFLTDNPIILDISDNKFYNQDIFYESINGFRDSSNNKSINISFDAPLGNGINNFRIEYYKIVDKFAKIDEGVSDDLYIPSFGNRSYIVDSFAGWENKTISLEQNENGIILRKNLATLDYVGTLPGVELRVLDYISLADKVGDNKVMVLLETTRIYSGDSIVKIVYVDEDDEDFENKHEAVILSNSNIEFNRGIKIIGIQGDAYIKSDEKITYKGQDIATRMGKPLFEDAEIIVSGIEENYNESSHIDITYYDGTKLYLNPKDFRKYTLYDLGNIEDDYLVQLDVENDFYYSKIRGFKNNIFSTESSQNILAPQNASDSYSPELSGIKSFNIPVYYSKSFDLSSYIYEDGGIENIKEVYIDSNFKYDTDDDNNTFNDKDTVIYKENSEVLGDFETSITNSGVSIIFNEFNEIFSTPIRVSIVDNNNNIGYSDILLNIYSPELDILSDDNGELSGKLDEKLGGEPVSLYRVRGGSISKLKDNYGTGTFNTVETGDFKYDINSQSGLTIKVNIAEALQQDIAYIDENTGKISIKQDKIIKIDIRVLASNDSNNDLVYPKIILSYDDKDVYYMSYRIENIFEVNYLDNFKNIDTQGVYVSSINSNYSYYTIANNIEYNPGALVIYNKDDSKKQALITVFNDGRINIEDGYNLSYGTYNNYPIIKIMKGSEKIAKVFIKTEDEYMIK